MIYIILVIVLIILFIFIFYNSLVKANNRVNEAFSTMDVYLKKRWDLIPNMVNIVKGYAEHENETLKDVVKLRNVQYDGLTDNDKIKLNQKLECDINILIESYPDLKANANYLDLSKSLEKTSEDIANSRKYYNGCVRIYNNKVEMFPSNIISKMFNFKEKEFFEIKEERENTNMSI